MMKKLMLIYYNIVAVFNHSLFSANSNLMNRECFLLQLKDGMLSFSVY